MWHSIWKSWVWFCWSNAKQDEQDWANIAAQRMFDQKTTTTNNSWWWHKQKLIEFIESILLLSTSSWFFLHTSVCLRLKLHAHIQHLFGIFIHFCSAYCKLLFTHWNTENLNISERYLRFAMQRNRARPKCPNPSPSILPSTRPCHYAAGKNAVIIHNFNNFKIIIFRVKTNLHCSLMCEYSKMYYIWQLCFSRLGIALWVTVNNYSASLNSPIIPLHKNTLICIAIPNDSRQIS